MTNLSRIPLTAFDPRFRTLLDRGCREVIEIPCESRTAAQHLRNVLTTYRARLKKENPSNREVWEPLYGTIVSTRKDKEHVVTLRPRLAEFDAMLTSLALEAPPTLPSDPLNEFIKEDESK